MLLAKEMAQLAESPKHKDDSELAEVVGWIESAAGKGGRGILTARLSDYTKTALTNNGFIVEESDSDDIGMGEFNTISW